MNSVAAEVAVVVPRARPFRMLVYGLNFWPELTGVGKFTGEMCRWLSDRGHHIEVVTAPPYYPAWEVTPEYDAFRYAGQTWAGVGDIRITRCPTWVPRRVNTWRRLVHLASFAASSFPALVLAMRRRPDVLFVVAPTLFVAPMALVLARLMRVPIWLHVQDFEVGAMFGLSLTGSHGFARRFAFRTESLLFRAFDRVSSISSQMVCKLHDKGIPPARCVLFPNWVDLSAVYPMEGDNALRISLGVQPHDVLVLYSGNMGEKQGLETLIDAARILQTDSRIKFVLAGDGAARQRLQAVAAGMRNVVWCELQPVERLNEVLNAADIHVLPQRADAADLVMPSKLTGMFASGRATVGTAQSGTQLGIALESAGQRVPPENAPALAQAIIELANNPGERARLGHAGRRYAEEHFGQQVIMRRFESELGFCVQASATLGNPRS